MFNSTFGIDQVGNVAEGARVSELAHLNGFNQPLPPVYNLGFNAMPVRLRRDHVGGSHPGVIVWRDNEFRVIAVAGSRDPADQVATIAGWSNISRSDVLPGKWNPYAMVWYQSIMNYISNELAAANKPTYFYSYSWGGAACAIVAKKMRQANPHQVSLVVSFGTPRFADFSGCENFHNIVVARLFNRQDPMPLLPPEFETAPFMHAAAGLYTSLQWAQFRHVNGGVGMSSNGALQPMIEPDLVPVPIDVNITDFIRRNVGEGRPHNITNYRIILTTAYPDNSPAATDPGVIIDEISGGHSSAEPRGKEPTQRETAHRIRSVIHSRVVVRTSAERATVNRTSRRLITVRRESSGYSVFIGQDRVYEATSKRDARGVANALRALSIQYGQQPDLWSREDLLTILKTYQGT